MSQPPDVPLAPDRPQADRRDAGPAGRVSGEGVGPDIKDLRKARGLTLQTLASRCGLSVGHLSEVERGVATPSVKALHEIAAGLGVTIGWFFQNDAAPAAERDMVVRAGARRRLRYGTGVTDELLSPNLRGPLEMILSRFAPGATSGAEPYQHRGDEAGLVVEGVLELFVGDKRFLLREGDSFAFPSTTPHRYRNPGDREAVVVWAITPPTY
jgi:transcriptional regulator with XRE-family HTH domain